MPVIKLEDIRETPNPDVKRFVLDKPLTEGEGRCFSNIEEAEQDELASSLLAIDHVEYVEYYECYIYVQQDGEADWSSLLKKLVHLIREGTPELPAGREKRDSTNREDTYQFLSPAIRKQIVRHLKEVIDPELGVNIVDLGLIYDIYEEDGVLVINFTATTPGCPMQHYLEQEVERSVAEADIQKNVKTQLVWEPSWNVEMMSSELKEYFTPT